MKNKIGLTTGPCVGNCITPRECVPCTPGPMTRWYIATKLVDARPMTLGEFHETHPEQKFPGNPKDEGYLVLYPQIGMETPYHGWCPKAQFEAQNQDPRQGMSFGHALVMLQNGKRVARAGWNGKGMWLCAPLCNGTKQIPATGIWGKPNAEYAEQNGGTVTVMPYVTMKAADGSIVMGWLASQTDLFANDWVLVG